MYTTYLRYKFNCTLNTVCCLVNTIHWNSVLGPQHNIHFSTVHSTLSMVQSSFCTVHRVHTTQWSHCTVHPSLGVFYSAHFTHHPVMRLYSAQCRHYPVITAAHSETLPSDQYSIQFTVQRPAVITWVIPLVQPPLHRPLVKRLQGRNVENIPLTGQLFITY